MDELENVLKTFKEKDPAGNGQTIPLMTNGDLNGALAAGFMDVGYGNWVDADGKVLIEAENGYMPAHDGTAHAERLLATQACTTIPADILRNATLYSSAEPCAMCAGAMYWAGIGRLVYGLSEHRLRDITGNHPENPTLNLPCRDVFGSGQRSTEVVGPLLEDEAAALHDGVWRK